MANRYFAGNSLAAFFRTSTAVVDGFTTAGYFDSAHVPSAINVVGNATSSRNNIQTYAFSATGTLFAHCEFRSNGTQASGAATWISFFNGATEAYRLSWGSTNGYQLSYWNGSAWVTGTSVVSAAINTKVQIDIKITLNSEMRVYVGGTELTAAAITGISGAQTTITHALGWSMGSSVTDNAYSQFMLSDYDMRDSKYMLAGLNGDSASNTNGTGAYTTINETVLDESTGVSLTTTAHKRGQTHAAITVPAGYVIGAAVWNARGRVNGTITDGKLGFRSGGTNYSSSGKTYNGGYEPRGHIIEDDPATATRFTQSGFNNAETYLEAV
jgi:hypothetical protein